VQLLKTFSAFYGTRKFIAVFTRALYWSLSYLRYILILSIHLRLGLPRGLFPSGLPTNILHAFLFSPFVPHTLPISFSLTYHSNYTWRIAEVMKLLIMQFSPTSCHFSSLRSTYSPHYAVVLNAIYTEKPISNGIPTGLHNCFRFITVFRLTQVAAEQGDIAATLGSEF
jgi:hypothetical protein